MPVENLGTVFICVSSLERSIEFYTQVFELKSRGIEDWGDGERAATLFFNSSSEIMITLVEVKEVQVTENRLFNLNCTEVIEMYKKIKEHDYKVSELTQCQSEWNKHIFFDVFDPDGNIINLIEVHKK
jgi:lactoylglutathione lyase